MYELENLYGQLKYRTVREMYISELNAVTESSYNEAEAKRDVADTIADIAKATQIKKTNLLDKRRNGVITAKKLLSKYTATAETAKPYGLSHKEYKTFKSDEDIKKLHENAVKYLEQFNPLTASDTEVKLYNSDIMDNVQYKALSTIFGEGDAKKCVKDCAISKKEACKEMTKEDIKNALSFMESFSENEDRSKYVLPVREAVNTYGISKERQIAANYKTALLAMADAKYYELMTEKVTLEFAQASQVITKAAHHNPRNLRESKEVQDYIDFLYEYNK